MLTLWSLAAAS